MITTDSILLVAGIGEVMGVLVLIVSIIVWAINQLLAARGNQPPARNAPRRPPQPAERALRPPGPPPKPQPDPASQLNAEIEQFLKRASQRRGERPSRERARAAAPQPPPKPPHQEPREVRLVERRDFDAVAASVEKHLANRGFSERAEHLADEVARADEEMERHLQQAFSHRVGTLASDAALAPASPVTDAQPTVKSEPPSAAASLAAILASPQGMRQAIVLAEILARPEHRW
jgi:hypothetical protein